MPKNCRAFGVVAPVNVSEGGRLSLRNLRVNPVLRVQSVHIDVKVVAHRKLAKIIFIFAPGRHNFEPLVENVVEKNVTLCRYEGRGKIHARRRASSVNCHRA